MQHRDTEQRDESDGRRDAEVEASYPEREHSTDGGERQVHEDKGGESPRAQRGGEQQSDQCDRHGKHEAQTRHGAGLVLELAAVT